MDFIVSLFTGTGMGSILVFLCITAFAGVALGKVGFKGLKLGIAGVLFVGLLLGHLKGAEMPLDRTVLKFVQEFGLILFVYCIGIEVGPRFFSTFKNEGVKMNIMACSVVVMGLGIAFAIKFFAGDEISSSQITGLMCGAVTNTPSLGAAQAALGDVANSIADPQQQQVLKDSIGDSANAYAVAYPFGVIGLISAILLVRFLFKINIQKEAEDYAHEMEGDANKLESVQVTVTNQNLFGSKISFIKKVIYIIMIIIIIMKLILII